MKSAKQIPDGAKTTSVHEAESAVKRTETEAKAAKAVFKEAKAKLKLARKAAKNTKKAARKAEKAAARARKTFDRLRKQAKKAAAQTKKKTATKAASSGSSAPARRVFRRKALASLAPDSQAPRPDQSTLRPAPESTAIAGDASQTEPSALRSGSPAQPEPTEGEHADS